jgi:hypothetical protein
MNFGMSMLWMVHILPEKIAEKRRHPQVQAIQILCLLSLLFAGLLWPLAWIWAYSKPIFYKMAYGTDVLEEQEHAEAPPRHRKPTKRRRSARESPNSRLSRSVQVYRWRHESWRSSPRANSQPTASVDDAVLGSRHIVRRRFASLRYRIAQTVRWGDGRHSRARGD